MSRLTGSINKDPTIAYEVTGQTRVKSEQFFSDIKSQIGSRWAVLRLCHIQKKWPKDTGIIGFQWKPYKVSLEHEYGIGAFKDMGNQLNPPIRVVYLIRNPLDRRTSNIRHEANKGITAHCTVDDLDCIENHKKTSKGGVQLPTGHELKAWLTTDTKAVRNVSSLLSMNGVRYIEVSYEKLYNHQSEDAEEWMRIFQFLGRGPAEGLSMADVRETFSMAATTVASRNETISNFADVEKSLRNTEYEHFLYD